MTSVSSGAATNNDNSRSSRSDGLSFTILWSPLPPITYILPFIGHMGIADSRGVASDFQGPYSVGNRGTMAFGKPTRALKLDVSGLEGGAEQWDDAIQTANTEYRRRMHNICCDNCHSHVAYALNDMNFRAYGISNWDMVKLCFLVFFRGRFLSLCGFLHQFVPTIIFVALMLGLTL
mmetsp:Transcript_20588/g.44506  ORF Transcript_20588/g.44506 Transcript_20588/m.44506 type:complete len:177 (-) Transcript_20588:129-659(-)|eukprot:CAMPEP_0178475574 /NCGR_PEP_ID=MMETSP0696-20121128/3187_1 /TAXON_ID=265572 /ORGANISM="Extubocellulus spinifer, Strain CCMP396" /LENGTH=176 /DNA_ID=CAMNT_0020102861 /DNA_START=98 /DNA_END=628 /DNA_ORIENTATION=+